MDGTNDTDKTEARGGTIGGGSTDAAIQTAVPEERQPQQQPQQPAETPEKQQLLARFPADLPDEDRVIYSNAVCRLTDKQAGYCVHYLNDPLRNAVQAAIRAGYSDSTARTITSQSRAWPHVLTVLGYLTGTLDSAHVRAEIAAGEARKRLATIRREARLSGDEGEYRDLLWTTARAGLDEAVTAERYASGLLSELPPGYPSHVVRELTVVRGPDGFVKSVVKLAPLPSILQLIGKELADDRRARGDGKGKLGAGDEGMWRLMQAAEETTETTRTTRRTLTGG